MMDDDKLLQRFPSPDGKRWFELRQQSDGMFYFQEFSEATDAVPVYGAHSHILRPALDPACTKAPKRPNEVCCAGCPAPSSRRR